MSSSFSDWMKEQQNENSSQTTTNSNWFSRSFQYVKQQTDIESTGLLNNVSSAGKAITQTKEKLTQFLVLMGLAALFFLLAYFIGLPTLVIRPAKFCISLTCGSILGLCSFAVLYGPAQYIKRLFSMEKIISTLLYFGSLFLCLFYALYEKSYVGTLVFTVIQILVFVYYTLEAFPAGSYVTTAIIKVIKQFFNIIWSLLKKCII